MTSGTRLNGKSHDRYVFLLFGIALVIHAALFVVDASRAFNPLYYGDRASSRWEALLAVYNAADRSLLDALVSAPMVPGEFIFQLLAFKIGGAAGIVIFQVALYLLSVLAFANILLLTVPKPRVRWVAGLIYIFLPQNLTFPHELVTEATATPLIVIGSYFFLRFALSREVWSLAISAILLGTAILVRPALVFIPLLLVLASIVYARFLPLGLWKGASGMIMIALIPLLGWVAIYTVQTGKLGYTSGVATLGWNLRSKVFLVYSRNGFPMPADLHDVTRYSDLYYNPGTMGVARFLELAAAHPVAFAEEAVVDTLQLFRGNASKFVVDYLGIGRDEKVKGWRDLVSEEGVAGAFRALLDDKQSAIATLIEVMATAVTGLAIAGALIFAGVVLVRPGQIADALGPGTLALILLEIAILASCLISAQIVDQSQGRLRHPAEAGIILLLAYAHLVRLNIRPLIRRPAEAPVNLPLRPHKDRPNIATLSGD